MPQTLAGPLARLRRLAGNPKHSGQPQTAGIMQRKVSADDCGGKTPSRRLQRFEAVLSKESVDKQALADLTWKGVPEGVSRCEVWQQLLGYRPLTSGRRQDALQRKRQEYMDLRQSLYFQSAVVRTALETGGLPPGPDVEVELLKQIRKDLPRMQLKGGGDASALVEDQRLQALMERVLFVWALRHPASGYVQGHNDVLLPLLAVFLADLAGSNSIDGLDAAYLSNLDEERLEVVEADCFWCLSKVLSEKLDHYTHGQPGVQRMVQRYRDVLRRIDGTLSEHLEQQGVQLLPTVLRWVTCLMVRELPIACCIRLWDTLIAESTTATAIRTIGPADRNGASAGFEVLFVYFCTSFTAYFSSKLQSLDFEGLQFFLQQMPTDAFTETTMDMLLGEAFVLKSLFQQAPQHFCNNGSDAG
mmetsp:Transcript_8872/g.15925  ORF Transcript_8872/g.15925 Transcript_8872/m.15925 type:complete len:416 (+) Transcript_8872:79-1326(+)